MTVYRLEMRSTQDYSDVRYREYTASARRAAAFCDVPRISFTDNGHGIVPVISEAKRGERRAPPISVLAEHVKTHLRVAPKPRLAAQLARNAAPAMLAALKWISENPHAHPANMVSVARDAIAKVEGRTP